ncbi:type VI secretion system Vgr family protein [Niabella beijingensis]|uniref:type VI secretion system Vgr family protein n=1 Tax=Niabella beijingensis TaxID=2872700 RepID=UPI001CC18F5E|nr:phage baseplate assembly protein V [Niabella beijingensis]MBZ4187941.1 phage baseplate assembly protein V [Niabella beijingensis]
MAQLTQPVFSINGKPLAQFTSFSLHQTIFDHHRFSLTCPAQTIDGKGGIFSASKDMVGATFGARIASIGAKGAVLFNGIVTSVETARFTGHHGDVIISGYSPTIVMDSGPHCKSWEKKAVKNIAQEVLKFFPQNLLEPKIQPLYGETLAYTVQYKETAWQFLKRLTSTFGEWLYWDGRNLVVGQPGGNKTADLVYGSNLNSFNISLQARPTQMQMMAWDYMNSEVYTSQPSGIEQKAGLNPWGEQVYKAGQAVYATQPKLWNNQFLTNKKQQEDVLNIRSAMASSRIVRFSGQSGHPGVTVGSTVEVKGNNVFSSQSEGYGDYLITAVNHYVDAQGNYENDFSAVPSTIKVPPIEQFVDPNCETQSAIVTDNNDFNGLGRVRVKFHWMNGAEKSPWIRVTTPHAGGGKGMFLIPEVGEEVIVGFEGDSATKPYVIGAVYHGQAKNSFGNAGNDVKALQSRSGSKLILNDQDSSAFLGSGGGGGGVMMDGKGKMAHTSDKEISLTCGLSSITLKEDGTITVSGKNIINIATVDLVSSAENNMTLAANNEMTAAGTVKASFVSTETLVGGTADLTLSAPKLAALAASEMKMNAGKMDLSSSGNVGVTGAIVKLNA